MAPLAKSNKKKAKSLPKYWVGIGASAGGLEALRGFVRHLPADVPATYIVTQHVAPQHRSMLTEIIGRETELDVQEVKDRTRPRPNTIYITPPNKNLEVEGDLLRLTQPSKQVAAPKPSVNHFFSSLASAKGVHSVGIIMSGTGSDGAKGMREIHMAGGITIAQDYMTAKYSSMPVAAIDTGEVDLVMSPEEMASQIDKIVAEPRDLTAFQATPVNMDNISELMQILNDRTNVDFRHYKTPTFQRRVERRIAACRSDSLSDYVSLVRSSPQEAEELFSDLLITVTSFFRDPAEFEALRSYVRGIIKERDGQPIRVWVAGTATGEEAYTIAILFAEEMGGRAQFSNARIQIFASDLDAKAIEVARRGYYSETSLSAVPPEIVERYFTPAPLGFTVAKGIREKIIFSVHNLAKDPPLLNLDLVSCRNLLIYFQPQLQELVLSRFHYALKPRGVLFLGRSETVSSAPELFTAADAEKHIFHQRPILSANMIPREVYQTPEFAARQPSGMRSDDQRELGLLRVQVEGLIRALGPNGLMVDEDLRILSSHGDVARYVGLAGGKVDNSIMSLLKEPYRGDVRAAVPQVLRKQEAHIGVLRVDEAYPGVATRVKIYPIEPGPDSEPLALVVFEETEETPAPKPEDSGKAQNAYYENQIKALSDELQVAKSNLSQLVEELETSNEELQALNEELQSSNEELQSTNEELETSNEELQSTNEELSTVNEELTVSSGQMNALNQSLNSILENISAPLIVVDRDLMITQVSKASEAFFDISADLRLPHVSRCRLPEGAPPLVELIEEAMHSGRRIDRQITGPDIDAVLTVAPHFAHDVDLIGAIVLVNDNSPALRAARDELQLVIDNLPASVLVRDQEGQILAANKLSHSVIGKPRQELVGTNMAEHCSAEAWARISRLDQEAARSGEPILREQIEYVDAEGRAKRLDTSRVTVRDGETGQTRIYAMALDVTAEHEAVQALATSKRRLDHAIEAAGLGIWEMDLATGAGMWSPRYLEILGLEDKAPEIDAAFMRDLIHPDDQERVVQSYKDHMEEGAAFDTELRMRHRDGHYLWLRDRAKLHGDGAGSAQLFVGSVQDITHEKQVNLEVRARNAQLSLASKMAQVGYWEIDLQEGSLFWSNEVYAIHGETPKSYVPELETAIAFYHADDVDMVRRVVSEAMEKAEPFEFEARIQRRNGEIRSVAAKCSIQTDERGAAISIFGVFRDRTEERAREAELGELLEALTASNEELNRFSYVCSHDMKEPVRTIETMTNMLLDPAIMADQGRREEILSRINVNMIRLRGIIDGLLAYSRVDAKVAFRQVDLGGVIDEVLDSLSVSIQETGARVARGKMPVLWGARVHFLQLFQNLIGNAVKHSGEGGTKIKLSSVQRKTQIILRVEDSGPGVPEASREAIFEVFQRLQRRDETEGTGLGLSISKKIVAQYGGTITCKESALGGALFEIRLPVEAGRHDPED